MARRLLSEGAPAPDQPMRSWILLICFLLAPTLARADELERSIFVASGEGAETRFARALEARVGEVLDRSVAVAGARATVLLERREAERLGKVSRAAARRAALQRAFALARGARRGELAFVRVASPSSFDRSP